MEDLSTIQEYIDDNKEQIPENIYLDLCNLTKNVFKKNGGGKKFYRLTFVSNIVEQMGDCIEVPFKKYTQVMEMPTDQAEKIKERIRTYGYALTEDFCRARRPMHPLDVEVSEWTHFCTGLLPFGNDIKVNVPYECDDECSNRSFVDTTIITTNMILNVELLRSE